MAGTNTNEQAAIRTWASAMRSKDADGVVSQYAPDNVKFILAPPLRYTKDHPFDKKSLQESFSSFQGPIDYENRDLDITAGDDVAFCHSLNRMMATTTKGKKVDLRFARPSAFARSPANGRSRTNTARYLSIWTVALKRPSISSHSSFRLISGA